MCIGTETGLFIGNQLSEKVRQQILEWDEEARTGNFTHWVEKTPAHICHAKRIFEETPDAKIVWIHRDPMSVTGSLFRRGNFKNVTLAFKFWVETNKCILDLLPHPKILSVAHADFTSEDRVLTVLANISAFLGLPQPEDRLALSLLPPANATRCHPVTCRRYPNDAAKRRDLHAALVRTLAAQALAEDEAHWQLLLDHGLRRPRPIFHDRLRSWQLCRPWYPVRDRFYHRVPSPARLRLAGEIGPAALGVVNSLYPGILTRNESESESDTDDSAPPNSTRQSANAMVEAIRERRRRRKESPGGGVLRDNLNAPRRLRVVRLRERLGSSAAAKADSEPGKDAEAGVDFPVTAKSDSDARAPR